MGKLSMFLIQWVGKVVIGQKNCGHWARKCFL